MPVWLTLVGIFVLVDFHGADGLAIDQHLCLKVVVVGHDDGKGSCRRRRLQGVIVGDAAAEELGVEEVTASVVPCKVVHLVEGVVVVGMGVYLAKEPAGRWLLA